MTKIESRSPVDLDDLPPWDDTDAPVPDDLAGMPASRRLTPYSLDSEQRTLVGIGPAPRARRSRTAASGVESQRMPPSEPPGPFIAEDEDPFVASSPRRKLAQRSALVSGALLLPLAVLGLVRGVSMHIPSPTEPAHVAAALVPQKAEARETPKEPPPAVVGRENDQAPLVEPPRVVVDSQEPTPEAPPARPRSSTQAAEKATPEVAPLSVKLPEVPPSPNVVDRSKGNVDAGIIQVASTPPANVVLDGRPLGKSPRLVRVPAGPHTLVFIHPLYGRRSVSVNVRPGATTSAAAEF